MTKRTAISVPAESGNLNERFFEQSQKAVGLSEPFDRHLVNLFFEVEIIGHLGQNGSQLASPRTVHVPPPGTKVRREKRQGRRSDLPLRKQIFGRIG